MYEETSADLSAREGDNASLVCRATGHPPPRVTWRREDADFILLRRSPRDIVKGMKFTLANYNCHVPLKLRCQTSVTQYPCDYTRRLIYKMNLNAIHYLQFNDLSWHRVKFVFSLRARLLRHLRIYTGKYLILKFRLHSVTHQNDFRPTKNPRPPITTR